MPLFEYECKDCGHISTFLEKADTKGVHKCEECGKFRLEKTLSTFSARVTGNVNKCPTGGCPDGSCCSSGVCNV